MNFYIFSEKNGNGNEDGVGKAKKKGRWFSKFEERKKERKKELKLREVTEIMTKKQRKRNKETKKKKQRNKEKETKKQRNKEKETKKQRKRNKVNYEER